MYSIKAQKVDGFDSRLEKQWAEEFAQYGLPYSYVGDRSNWCDFLIADILPVEIKPDIPHLIDYAHSRISEKDFCLVIAGDPNGHNRAMWNISGVRIVERMHWHDEVLVYLSQVFIKTGVYALLDENTEGVMPVWILPEDCR